MSRASANSEYTRFGIGPDAHIWGKFKRRFWGDYVRRLHLTVGDTVKVLSGPFADWVARIERLPEKDRVVLMFEMMGREVAVGVDVGNLQRA